MSSDRIRIAELRDSIDHGLQMRQEVPARDLATLTWDEALALVAAVEAARMYRLRHAVESPNEGQKITRDRLDDALARFDFVSGS